MSGIGDILSHVYKRVGKKQGVDMPNSPFTRLLYTFMSIIDSAVLTSNNLDEYLNNLPSNTNFRENEVYAKCISELRDEIKAIDKVKDTIIRSEFITQLQASQFSKIMKSKNFNFAMNTFFIGNEKFILTRLKNLNDNLKKLKEEIDALYESFINAENNSKKRAHN